MKKPPPKIRRGEVITAEFLNRLIRLEQALGWGSGSRTGGKLDSPGVQWFKAQEDFTAFEDVYRGDAKLWWYKPASNAYAVHNDAITVYSHADDVATDDVFGAAFNVQSGRWEKVSGGCACPEIWCFIPLAPSAGTWNIELTVNSVTETLTFDYNTTAAAMETELLTHSELTTGDVDCKGGAFPSVAIYCTWSINDSDINTGFPVIDESSLTGNVTMYKFSSDYLG